MAARLAALAAPAALPSMVMDPYKRGARVAFTLPLRSSTRGMEPGSFMGARPGFLAAGAAVGLFSPRGRTDWKAFSSLGAAFRGCCVLFISKLIAVCA